MTQNHAASRTSIRGSWLGDTPRLTVPGLRENLDQERRACGPAG